VRRRDLLRRGALGLAALGVGARRGNGQTPVPDTAAADRLYRPDLVQQRGIATASDNDPVVKSLEHRLKCTCGCNLDIYTCRTTDFTCTYSPALHREVLDLRAAGKEPEQVVEAFVAKYGEQILMAPPARGFNLAGYLVPGAAVALAGSTLALILIRRGRRMAAVADAVHARGAAMSAEPSPEDRERLRDALSRVQD
jgi:cytochrome c-type biogenesis protein CcmH/NrfF